MAEYASKGLANGLGIPAVTMAGLALLNQTQTGGGGILGGLLGGGGYNDKLMTLMTENSLLKSENYSDKVANEVYKQSALDNTNLSDRLLDKYISPMAQEIADRRVKDARMEEQLKCLNQKMELREEIMEGKIAQVADKSACGISQLGIALNCLQQTVNGITKVIVPQTAVCPQPMPLYNSWTAPTTPTP